METRKHRNYSEDEVVRILSRKNDLRIDRQTGLIEMLNDRSLKQKGDVGNGSKGKIDFLTKHCGYTLVTVGRFK